MTLRFSLASRVIDPHLIHEVLPIKIKEMYVKDFYETTSEKVDEFEERLSLYEAKIGSFVKEFNTSVKPESIFTKQNLERLGHLVKYNNLKWKTGNSIKTEPYIFPLWQKKWWKST